MLIKVAFTKTIQGIYTNIILNLQSASNIKNVPTAVNAWSAKK
ncbi:hypothetical protein LFAB_03070 [Lactiplantibacillus fabifermentans T30PCM01]|uniref:Uncharacterized protein n=1 Tax=Lactiplantibacillus fabifermentans T30PCM01 TaxID=1400520 RepID=W6T9X4_9LACO|nr:hypothetical protein LFAB_03070 [Lactiplantibacillus fabifermentans T30PCM01]